MLNAAETAEPPTPRQPASSHVRCCFIGLLLSLTAALCPAQQPELPEPAQQCPAITEGVVSFLGVDVMIVVAGSADLQGPLILYWHGTGTDPLDELKTAFDAQAQQQLRAMGGLLVAFLDSTGNGQTTSGNGIWSSGDMLLADEVIGCANAAGGIDPDRVHLMGMSAGGLHATAMSYQRAHYVASIAVLSGGHLLFQGQDSTETTASNPDNPFAALIIHGGERDRYILDFQLTSREFAATLQSRGHPVVLCNHRQGHSIPMAVSAAAWGFFRAHPFASPADEKIQSGPELTALCQPE